MLVLEPEAGEEAEQYPETWVTAANDADHDQHTSHPEDRLKAVHRQNAVDHQVDRGDEYGESGQRLGKGPTAELARDQHGQSHHSRAGQHRQDPQRRQRAAERQRDLGVDRHQRRAVDITPVEVAGAVEEVELVAEVAVPEKAG